MEPAKWTLERPRPSPGSVLSLPLKMENILPISPRSFDSLRLLHLHPPSIHSHGQTDRRRRAVTMTKRSWTDANDGAQTATVCIKLHDSFFFVLAVGLLANQCWGITNGAELTVARHYSHQRCR